MTSGDSILAVFGGFRNINGNIITTPDEDVFTVSTIYKAFEQLVGEFPDSFPGFVFESVFGMPYSEELERALFRLGSCGLTTADIFSRVLRVTPESKQAMRKSLEKRHYRETMRHFVVLSERFYLLVQQFS